MNLKTHKLKGILWRAGVNGCGVFGVKPPFFDKFQACCEPVSYTHLTLPTICSV